MVEGVVEESGSHDGGQREAGRKELGTREHFPGHSPIALPFH